MRHSLFLFVCIMYLARADVCCIPSTPTTCIDDIDVSACTTLDGFHRTTNITCAESGSTACALCLPCTTADSGAPACTSDFRCPSTPERLQGCARRYSRCFVPAVRRRRPNIGSAPFVCGGSARVDLACAVDVDETRCAIGRCVYDAEFGAYGQTICTDLREFPCSCACSSPLRCGSIEAHVYEDVNHNGIPDDGETRGVNTSIGLWRSVFQGAPLRVTFTNAQGLYVFSDLFADTYYVSIVGIDASQNGAYVPVQQNIDSTIVVCSSSSLATATSNDVVETTAHDLFITLPKFIQGRVVYDATASDSNGPGIEGAIIRALLRPTLSLQGEVTTLTTGEFVFTSLPDGFYDFIEIDVNASYTSTGDSQGANDNRLNNIEVTNGQNITSLRFYDYIFPATNAPTSQPSHHNRHNGTTSAPRSECLSVFSWLWYIECYAYVFEYRLVVLIFTLLAILACCLCMFILCMALACGSLMVLEKTHVIDVESETSPTTKSPEKVALEQQEKALFSAITRRLSTHQPVRRDYGDSVAYGQ